VAYPFPNFNPSCKKAIEPDEQSFRAFNIIIKTVPDFSGKSMNHHMYLKYLLFMISLNSLMVSCHEGKQGSATAPPNRSIITTLRSGDMVLVQWKTADGDCFASEIGYTTASGRDTTVNIPGYQMACQLLNYNKSDSSFRYRTLYLKTSTPGDTSYSQYTTVSNIPKGNYRLPEKTSKYNLGGSQYAGRYKDGDGHIKTFKLVGGDANLYDGSGRKIGLVTLPVKLNMGTEKQLKIAHQTETCVWAWDTNAGLSGWVPRRSLVAPPDLPGNKSPFAVTDPRPPGDAATLLKIDAAAGTSKLTGLVHRSSNGAVPVNRGNHGTDYAGRNPGPLNYVYLQRAVPNVQKGGTSKDSMSDGSLFVPAVDNYGRQITETMTMYRSGNLDQPVNVTFIYGRPSGSSDYGWIARANVGSL
jgi:hypothetical protein